MGDIVQGGMLIKEIRYLIEKIAKYGFLEGTDSCECTCFFPVTLGGIASICFIFHFQTDYQQTVQECQGFKR